MAHSWLSSVSLHKLSRIPAHAHKGFLPRSHTQTCVTDSALCCRRTRILTGVCQDKDPQWNQRKWSWEEDWISWTDFQRAARRQMLGQTLIWCRNAQTWCSAIQANIFISSLLRFFRAFFWPELSDSGCPPKSHTEKWIKWAEKPNAAVRAPGLGRGFQYTFSHVWPLCRFEALLDSLKVFTGMPRVHLWVTLKPLSWGRTWRTAELRVIVKQRQVAWLVQLKRSAGCWSLLWV